MHGGKLSHFFWEGRIKLILQFWPKCVGALCAFPEEQLIWRECQTGEKRAKYAKISGAWSHLYVSWWQFGHWIPRHREQFWRWVGANDCFEILDRWGETDPRKTLPKKTRQNGHYFSRWLIGGPRTEVVVVAALALPSKVRDLRPDRRRGGLYVKTWNTRGCYKIRWSDGVGLKCIKFF